MGHKMVSWYPYVPIGGEMGLNCAILSYNGTAYFGFTCDVGAVPDPENLEKFVAASCAELLNSSKDIKIEPAKPQPRATTPVKRKSSRRKRPNATIPVAERSAGPKPAAAIAELETEKKLAVGA